MLKSESDADVRRKCRCSTSGTVVETCYTGHIFRPCKGSINQDKAGTAYILPVATVVNTGNIDGGRPGTAICLLCHSIKKFEVGCDFAPQTREASCVVRVFPLYSVEATMGQAYGSSSVTSRKYHLTGLLATRLYCDSICACCQRPVGGPQQIGRDIGAQFLHLFNFAKRKF